MGKWNRVAPLIKFDQLRLYLIFYDNTEITFFLFLKLTVYSVTRMNNKLWIFKKCIFTIEESLNVVGVRFVAGRISLLESDEVRIEIGNRPHG